MHTLVRDMDALLEDITVKTYREVYNGPSQQGDDAQPVRPRLPDSAGAAHIERAYYQILQQVGKVIRSLDYVPEEFETLPQQLADMYVCNFSLFRRCRTTGRSGAVPDRALSRLNERPT